MSYLRSNWKMSVGLLLLAVCAGLLFGQAAAPPALPQSVQINPPGSTATSQTFWSQTATGAASAATVTQPAVAGKVNWCTGFEITGSGATAASVITVTLASGGTTVGNYQIAVPAGVTAAVTPLVVEFPQPFGGLGPGQNMVLTVPSFGAGNTNSAATMHGFTQ